jgi:hypothetical protein
MYYNRMAGVWQNAGNDGRRTKRITVSAFVPFMCVV